MHSPIALLDLTQCTLNNPPLTHTVHSPIALLNLTQGTSQTALLCLTVHSQIPFLYFSHALSKHPPLSQWHSPTALLYLLLSCTPLYLSMSHSALPGSSPLFLIVHFPTALPNAVLSPLVQHYVCWGVVWGECANRKMATFSTLAAEEKKERERKVFISYAHLLWLVLQPLHSTSKTGVCQSPTIPRCSPRRRGRHNPLDTGTVLQMAVYDWSSPVG